MNQVTICVIIFLLMILSFILNKFPMCVTALLALVAMVLTGCLSPADALLGFGNQNIIIMGAMFIVGAGLSRTQLVNHIASLLKRVGGGNFTIVLAGYVVLTCLIGQVVPSAMATFAITFPVALATFEAMGASPSKAMFSIGITAIGTVANLPIGSGAVQYVTLNQLLEAYDYTAYQFTLFDQFKIRLPLMIVIVLYAIFIAPRLAPDQPVTAVTTTSASGGKKKEPLSPLREKLAYLIFIVTMVGLIFQSYIGIELWVVCIIGALLMVAVGVLNYQESAGALYMDMILLIAAGLGIATAMTQTGTAEVIGDFVDGLLGTSPNSYLIGFVFFFVPFVLTQFMLNASVIQIFQPICIMTCKALACNPIGPLTLVMMGSLTAFMTPLATPTVGVVMATGGYDVKSLLKMGWLPAIIFTIVAVVWAMTIFPAY